METSKPQVKSINIGDTQVLILRSEQEIPAHSLTCVRTKILIDAREGSFYLFAHESSKDNQAHEPFLAELEKIIQTFRITNP